MANETKISKIDQEIQFDAESKPVQVYMITFMVGTHGPFRVALPAADYTAAAGKAAIEKRAMEIRNTIGF
jgi:hypothetical protein